MKWTYPFAALVGQDEMRLAMLLTAIDAGLGGVLVLGDRGTGKSTAVRGLAALLPLQAVVPGCRYGCSPTSAPQACPDCITLRAPGAKAKRPVQAPVPVVDLPLGATEDRIVGALDLERALSSGIKTFEPGLLARANRGFLYVDEINLLEDHLVDLLIDVAASGENRVERDGLSLVHPAAFVLVGSGNPEEGELRPQLLDRFGLAVEVRTPTDLPTRVEVVKRRDAFEHDPESFCAQWQNATEELRGQLLKAQKRLNKVSVPDQALEQAAQLCTALGTDGLRGDLTLVRAARALAAWQGSKTVRTNHLREVAAPALRHRLRRNPLDDTGSTTRVARAVAECWGET